MTFTKEQKEAYRLRKMSFAYSRAEVARDIVRSAYYRANPTAHHAPRDGILSCGLPITHAPVKVYLDEKGHEHHDHKACKSWACPICAPKRAHARAKDIERVMIAANEQGMTQLFLTFTVPHRKAHSSKFVIDRLNVCYNRFLQSKAVRCIKAEHGYIGAMKCLDYTLTDNGTHAHLHCIFIFDTALDAFDLLVAVGAAFVKQWDKTVFNECGQHISQRHGFSVEIIDLGDPDDPNASSIARYAAKAISVYCSDGDKDKGSRTPFDLLQKNADERDRALFYDFYKGQKGRRHVYFSRGLRDRLAVGSLGSDERERPTAAIAAIEYEHGYYLREESHRAEFEHRLAFGVVDALCWLNAKTKEQQAQLGSRYCDGADRPLNFAPVAFHDVTHALESGTSLPSDEVANICAEQSSFLRGYEDIRERTIMEKSARIHEEHERYLNRVKRQHANECRAAKREKRAPRSGLGAALALADANAPRRESLFYGVGSSELGFCARPRRFCCPASASIAK